MRPLLSRSAIGFTLIACTSPPKDEGYARYVAALSPDDVCEVAEIAREHFATLRARTTTKDLQYADADPLSWGTAVPPSSDERLLYWHEKGSCLDPLSVESRPHATKVSLLVQDIRTGNIQASGSYFQWGAIMSQRCLLEPSPTYEIVECQTRRVGGYHDF